MLRFFCRLIVSVFARITVRGPVPEQAPEKMIVIANHQSFLDGIILGLALPFDLTWIVHTTIAAQWHFKQFLKHVPHLVVDVTSPLAMKAVANLIEQGKPVAIFPEGRITVTGSLMKMYDGVAFLAMRTGAQLLPVWIEGAVHTKATRHKAPFPSRWRMPVTLTFFPLETLPVPVARTARERRRLTSDRIRRRLEEMSVASQPAATVFETFLDAVELYGRKRPILSDITFKEHSYGEILRGRWHWGG
jgi:acyl-[acyl-carrier-protein]-phospholipid O-acyltransferase / long-chain-fatty-acid--[acyl-carrier-protein] ligase